MAAVPAIGPRGAAGGRGRRAGPALLGLAGAALLALAAATLWRHANVPAPYRYVEVAAAAAASSSSSSSSSQAAPAAASAAAPLRTLQVVAAADERVVAEAETAAAGDGSRVLLAWRARVDDPLLYLPPPKDETQALAAVLARHRDAATPVLAWWDTSRQLRHWGGGAMRFDRHLALPLFVPPNWAARKAQVMQAERAFWGGSADADSEADAAQRQAFETFAGALVAAEDEGVRRLRALVGGRKALVVLHVRDVLLLGEMFPQAIGVSFQDFNDAGDVHRSVRGVRGWLQDAPQVAYTVIKQPGNVLRAVALRDAASANTLAARLLPFIGNRQDDVAGLTLVYRNGGFAIYELAAAP
ncbi:MAG: hydroxylamine oxidation protein HaoB [Proteobacteria bacterium]|nr:hydroxylamine oxidation protein HaoB [Pseudomonadota bacterium]